MVRKKGLEPLRPFGHQLLRLARLPIPPLPRGGLIITLRESAEGAPMGPPTHRQAIRVELSYSSCLPFVSGSASASSAATKNAAASTRNDRPMPYCFERSAIVIGAAAEKPRPML